MIRPYEFPIEEMGNPNDYRRWIGKSKRSLVAMLRSWRKGNVVLVDRHQYDAAYVFTRLVQQAVKTAQMDGLITPQDLAKLSKRYRLDIWL